MTISLTKRSEKSLRLFLLFIGVLSLAFGSLSYAEEPDVILELSREAGITESSSSEIVLADSLKKQQVTLDAQIARAELLFEEIAVLNQKKEVGQTQDDFFESEGDIQVLEETLVEDTFLDPFEEEESPPIEDPFETVNSSVFSFNLNVDRYLLKPIAAGYEWVMPDFMERAIGRAIQNIRFVPRFANNIFQGKMAGAGLELTRFVLNSSLGIAGLWDIAEAGFGLTAPPEEDTGQTLAVYGMGPGPYVVLPFLPPTSLRDGVGLIGDLALDPLTYLLTFVPQASLRGTEVVNDRAQTLEIFEGVEESTLDLYGAVREAYSQRRIKAIQE